MAAWAEMLDAKAIGRTELLRVVRCCEPLPALFPSACRLVGVLCLNIEIPMLAILHLWKHLSCSDAAALHFIDNETLVCEGYANAETRYPFQQAYMDCSVPANGRRVSRAEGYGVKGS